MDRIAIGQYDGEADLSGSVDLSTEAYTLRYFKHMYDTKSILNVVQMQIVRVLLLCNYVMQCNAMQCNAMQCHAT